MLRNPMKGDRTNPHTTWAIALAGFAAIAFGTPTNAETDFPTRPITVIVPFAAGGSSDIVMRLAAAKASETLKQSVVIDNRPGGAGNVAAMVIKNAQPDGYTLMMGHTGTHAINATLYKNLGFDPVKDFAPIAPLISFNNLLLVNTTSPAKSAKELVTLGKSKSQGLTYGSQGVGTGGHLLGVLLAQQTGINLTHVPYKGVAPALNELVADRIDFTFASYLTARPHVEAGKLRRLAIAGFKRNPALPELPTMGEAGFPEVAMDQWFGLFAPAGTPKPVVDRLNKAFVDALNDEGVKAKLQPQGSVVIVGSPDDLAAMIKRDIKRLGAVVEASGVERR